MADTVSVTQADREAAAKFFRYASWEDARENGGSHGPIITARLAEHFARHRLASTQPAPAFPREEVARLRAALQAILALDTQPVHVGYDHGAGGGNYVYEDFISADAAFGLARAALLQGKQP